MQPWLKQTNLASRAPRKGHREKQILAIPSDFLRDSLASTESSNFYPLPLHWLLKYSVARYRSDIEEDENFVQLVGLFHIVYREQILVYLRSHFLAEERLRGKMSINFGGHVQPPKTPSEILDANQLVKRELFDELSFCGDHIGTDYLGCLYTRDSEFSSRHIGICVRVTPTAQRFRSREAHLQTQVRYEAMDVVRKTLNDYDNWSAAILMRSGLLASVGT